MFFILEQGRHSTKTSALFIMLAIAFSAVTLLAYANYASDANSLDINSLGCAIACYLDSDCNDENQSTIDICNNDASCESYCTNLAIKPACAIACNRDTECDDSNPETIDVCNNDGTCEAECTSIAIETCEIACSSDTDCDDGNPETIDICNNDGTCQAECSSLPMQETKGKAIEKGHVLPSFSLKGLSGEKIGYGLEMIDETGGLVKSIPAAATTAAAEQVVPAGLYNIELIIDSNPIKKIVLKNAVIDSNSNALELQMLPNTQTVQGKEVKNPFLLNPLSEFETGQILLTPPAGTNAVVKCTNWDRETNTCNEEWQTAATYNETSEEISINAPDEEAAIGFTEITIINVQSYPAVGGEWQVLFTTVGKADLAIRPVDGTTWSNENEDKQLKFLDIKCGSNVLPYQWVDGTVLVQDYECLEIGYETSKVITAGAHHLEFDFGGQKAYAHNQTDVNLDPLSGANTDGDSGVLAAINTDDTTYTNDRANSADNWTVGQTFDWNSLSGTINSITAYVLHQEVDSILNKPMEIMCCPGGAVCTSPPTNWVYLGDATVSATIRQDSAAVGVACADTWAEIGSMWVGLVYTDDGGGPSEIEVDYIWVTVNYEPSEQTCECSTSGNWEINDGSVCTLSSLCNLPANLHISNGSLRIDPNGTLVVPSGSNIVVKKDTGSLFIDDGGKLVIQK